ncbi:MAG TPA: hypothetical protein VHR72_05560 [Gemmataceae bacterium]|jgi:hypothetical protein|nr:hypothetical protein [Gemmataceae bacterium]
MRIHDLRELVRSLGAFVAAQAGKPVTTDLDLMVAGLEPFDALELRTFLEHLHRAAGLEVQLPGKKPAAPKAAKAKTKSAADIEAVSAAVADLANLYDKSPHAECTYDEIERTVARIHDEFDGSGLKAVAMGFGLLTGVATKKGAKTKIAEKITKRKADAERGREIERVGHREEEIMEAMPID